ncbi:LAME_0G17502g1_1 [Lachancea meyersii CBS 8951]|uniref:LAME_0G17502g1_1 n=1 Tax=Lachancea meyersii CBS 8951 TaxID=1266667 RepID=A0A1G4KBE5_9SACH|nr:LAME_0G17502g1_1 [Lachancea meyersii CBS 8951]
MPKKFGYHSSERIPHPTLCQMKISQTALTTSKSHSLENQLVSPLQRTLSLRTTLKLTSVSRKWPFISRRTTKIEILSIFDKYPPPPLLTVTKIKKTHQIRRSHLHLGHELSNTSSSPRLSTANIGVTKLISKFVASRSSKQKHSPRTHQIHSPCP